MFQSFYLEWCPFGVDLPIPLTMLDTNTRIDTILLIMILYYLNILNPPRVWNLGTNKPPKGDLFGLKFDTLGLEGLGKCVYIFMCWHITSSVRPLKKSKQKRTRHWNVNSRASSGTPRCCSSGRNWEMFFLQIFGCFLDADETGRVFLHIRLMRFINFRGPTDDSERNEQEATNWWIPSAIAVAAKMVII